MTDTPIVFITGASSGIGYETALAFARAGYNVAGTARDKTRLDDLGKQVSQFTELLPLSVDVRDPQAVQAAVDETTAHFGRVDVVVANAGVGQRGEIVNALWEDVETLLRTNIDGVLHTVRAAVPAMKQQKSGHIVTVSSVTFNMILPGAGIYAASKAFVSSMARALRMELAADNIHVTDMVVGRTSTNFNKNRLGGSRQGGGSVSSMPPEKVAAAIVDAVVKRKRTVVVRPIDRLIVLMNMIAPQLIANIARRDYK